jgi:hypothetical protein
MTIEAMQQLFIAMREQRARELSEAFRDREVLRRLILWDSAHLIAGIGGYAAPSDRAEREKWIEQKMRSDPMFVAQVKATVALIQEYADMVRI